MEFPLWQVSKGTAISNGSLHPDQFQNVPILHWIDMPIEFQFECERVLHSDHHLGQITCHNDAQRLSEAVHIIDMQSMTILNTCCGKLNRIRRITTDFPHWLR